MSGPETPAGADALARSAEDALRAAESLLAEGRSEEVSDEAVQALITAGARLYARKVDQEHRYFRPVTGPGVLTPTDVAVTVSELLRAVDLNLFDLAMWSNRARPDEN